MEQHETLQKLLPPRVIHSITTGLTQVEKQPYLLLFPIIFDFILWLGPKISIQQFVMKVYSGFMNNAISVYEMTQLEPQALYDLQEMLSVFLEKFNLLSLGKTFPIGIPALLTNADTTLTPLGTSQVVSLSSPGSIFLVLVALFFIGIFCGVFFFRMTAKKINPNRQKNFFFQVANSLIYSVILMLILTAGGTIALLFSSFFAIFSPVIGQFLFLALLVLLLFLTLPSFYAFIPIFLFGQSFYQAILTSYKVVGLRMRFKISEEQTIILSPKVTMFSMSILVLYQGLNVIWLRIPPVDSWWMLIGIVGHAFISTAILLACFDFFQKMCEWHHRITQNEVC
ncbi:hypothetical protein EH221_04260 [bacterium]|nr:MAG: hypothetical protein EH221_04260 [bacterium]